MIEPLAEASIRDGCSGIYIAFTTFSDCASDSNNVFLQHQKYYRQTQNT